MASPSPPTINDRFAQLIQHLGLTKNSFAISLDKTASVIQHLIDGRNKPGFDLLYKVFEVYPNVSRDWMMLGQGPMLLDSAPTEPTAAIEAPPVTAAPPAPLAEPEQLPLIEEKPVVEEKIQVEPIAKAAPAVLPPSPVPPAPVAAPEPTPVPVATAAPISNISPDAYVAAALHTQHLQHQLALAEMRNQFLLEQQQMLRQMLEMAQR